MRSWRLVAAVVGALAATSPVAAQDYPSRPIHMIVPFAAGGPADILARAIAPALGAHLKQTIIVENRGGAGGVLGVGTLAKAAPDGYTIGLTGPGAVLAAPFMMKTPYDVQRDLAPLTVVARVNGVIVVSPTTGYKSLADLVAYAKAHPGAVTFASAGSGTSIHLAGELLNMEAGVKLVHVPYRGAAPAVTDLLGGHVAVMIPDLPVVLPHIRAGRLIALAVTSKTRSPLLPDVPTTAEAGLPGVLSDSLYGLIAPANTPAPVLAQLQAAAVAALHDPQPVHDIETQGAMPSPTSAAAYMQLLADEREKWHKVIEASGARME
ncbi:MAG TPA: tripartite tricarboxylate transporter substrate binding protein [Xanthobacteraceae bacterium]|nr:tripartite tricarboxylate transporter substrate binding protein [Xanthobacteraceae bacterium]